jgi:mono/diheme cytochrome c family protein
MTIAIGDLPEGEGRAIVAKSCSGCHPASLILQARKTEDQWFDNVDLMLSRGARIDDQDYDALIDYLVAHFGASDAAPSTAN